MLPVPNLEAFQSVWLDLKLQGFALYGFFLFVGADHFFPEYLNDSGLVDLESWTGRNCALFVFHSPSAEWVDYTQRSSHVWWRLFGHASTGQGMLSVNSAASEVISSLTSAGLIEHKKSFGKKVLPAEFEDIKDEPLLEIDGDTYSVADLFSSCHDHFQHAMEIQKVLHRFDLPPTAHPCFVLFQDLNAASGWFVDLNDMLNLPERELRAALKDWFAGPEFHNLIAEAESA
jgi:hypothetical protein